MLNLNLLIEILIAIGDGYSIEANQAWNRDPTHREQSPLLVMADFPSICYLFQWPLKMFQNCSDLLLKSGLSFCRLSSSYGRISKSYSVIGLIRIVETN